MTDNWNEKQVGGAHYRSSFQHWDWVVDNNVPYHEGNFTKYMSRWRKKNGIQDLQKSYHYGLKIYSLIEEGRVSENPTDVDVKALSDAYQLSTVESQICEFVCNWSDKSDVGKGLSLLKGLIKSEGGDPLDD